MSVFPASNYLVEFAQLTDAPRALPFAAKTGEPLNPAPKTRARELSEAFEKGVSEGRKAVEAELRAEMKAQQDAFAAERVASRKAWAENEAGMLEKAFAEGLAAIETRLAEPILRLVAPLLEEHIRDRAVAELRTTLRRLVRDGGSVAIHGSAPDDLIALLQDHSRCPELSSAKLKPGDCEIRLDVDGTIVETRMAAWLEAIRKTEP